jgi:hypothetical protein
LCRIGIRHSLPIKRGNIYEKKYRARLSVVVFLLAVTAVVSAIAIFRTVAASKSPVNSTEASHAHSPVSTSRPPDQLEAEVITILPRGFEPTEITRPKGRFLLSVENRSGLQRVEFHLSAESGSRIFQASRTWELADWNEVVNPPPGKYVLTETNHPSWQCVITITP